MTDPTPSPLSGSLPASRTLGTGLKLILVGSFLLLGAVGLGIALGAWVGKGPIAPSGGLFFPWRKEIAMTSFRQADPLWHEDRLGWSEGTLGAEGCAVASLAMVFDFYGIKTDPRQLNWFLGATNGFTDQGWLYWDRAAWLAPDRVRHVYEDLPSHYLIDRNLLEGNPVIARLRFAQGPTHFVVIAGKKGFDYLIRDPGAGAGRGCYPLKEIGSKIEALRYYERVE